MFGRVVATPEGDVNPPIAGTATPETKMIRDARGRLVTDKKANQPYLAYQKYKVEQEEKEKLKAEKLRRREEKLANGEPLGPEDELDKPTTPLLGFLKFILIVLVAVSLTGWFVTGSFLWEYNGKWAQKKTYFPVEQRKFTLPQLAHYDGRDGKPIYIALKGDVFDVSNGARFYGPGAQYYNFVGVDASRSFATRCTNGHRTHDLRGLSSAELQSLDGWHSFFSNSAKYHKVGTVHLPPIDPASSLPGECGKEPVKPTAYGPSKPPQQVVDTIREEVAHGRAEL